MVRQWAQRLAAMAMGTVLATVSAEPGVLAEIWTGIAGGDVANLTGHAKYRKTANSVQILKGFSIVSVGDKCGARYSATLSPRPRASTSSGSQPTIVQSFG